MKYFKCSVCGYLHRGEEPPQQCPNCGASADQFSLSDRPDEKIHMFYGEKVEYGDEPAVNPFFGNFKSLSPYIYNLPPHKGIPLHKHPSNDELFFIIKGKIRFTIGERVIEADQGDILKADMGTAHDFTNITGEAASFLSVKGPKPVKTVKIQKEE